MATLQVTDLHVSVADEEAKTTKEILKGVNLTMNTGETHASWDLTEPVNQRYPKQLWAIQNICHPRRCHFRRCQLARQDG